MTLFVRDYVKENGFEIKEEDQKKNGDDYGDYQDVTGQKQYITSEELAEMESVIYSISFGK